MESGAVDVKGFYGSYHDSILEKRYRSPFWLRRHTHRAIYASFLGEVAAGQTVLDAGCGEGALSFLLAQQGARVTGVDLSTPNIEAAREEAKREQLDIRFEVGDAEALPFEDNSFDVVVSSHVLEHLPNLQAGLREVRRVTKGKVVIAMPTCLSPAAWAILGKDNWWQVSRRTAFAVPVGAAKTLWALARGRDGPDEGYVGVDVPHVWRFPWVMRREIERADLRVDRIEGGPLVIPYLPEYVKPLRPLQERLQGLRKRAGFRYLGYGTHMVCSKVGR